jgi:8-amino-7-oxononanoate synthase
MSLDSYLKLKLNQREEENALRVLHTRPNTFIDFSSNDYLGFAQSIELKQNIDQSILELDLPIKNGTRGSRLLNGNYSFIEKIENELASFFKAQSALIFNSGYSANLGVLSSIPQKGDTIIYDELIHTSLKDGARLSFANRLSFKHNDPEDLLKKIQKAQGKIFLVLESVYSMDGDLCALEELLKVAEPFKPIIIVDEAHGLGVIGEAGEGLVLSKKLEDKIDIRIYTFGKAMGVHGAVVVGSKVLKDYLINFSRSFIYTTALSPHSYVAISESIKLLKTSKESIDKLQYYVLHMNLFFKSIHLYSTSNSAINTFILPGNDRVKNLSNKFLTNNMDIRPIMSPTVPVGSERLRICLHSYNTREELELLQSKLKEWI